MKILNLLSRLISFLPFTAGKSKITEAKLIGKWRYVNSRRWGTSGDESDFVTHYNTQNKVWIEFVEGNFSLLGNQLTFNDQTYTVEYAADTIVLSQPQCEETYIRWED